MACVTYWSRNMTEHRVIVDALNINYAARVVNNLGLRLATSVWRWWVNPARVNRCLPP